MLPFLLLKSRQAAPHRCETGRVEFGRALVVVLWLLLSILGVHSFFPLDSAIAENDLKGLLGNKKSAGGEDFPLLIKSDTLSLDSRGRVFTYKNNVRLQRGDLVITADVVEGRYNEGNQIQTVLAKGNVVITKGNPSLPANYIKATSNRALYNVQTAKIELTEGPELYRSSNALAADRVTIFVNEDRSEAEGNVRVKVLPETSAPGTKKPGASS